MANCIKWVGGKTKLYNNIYQFLQESLYKDAYIEPFLGSGAVAFQLLTTHENLFKNKTIILSDACWRLMNFYNYVLHEPENLILTIKKLPTDGITAEIYNKYRDYFNSLDKGIELAALFLWINMTCYNGMYRENKNGGYNVPFGKRVSINLEPKFDAILKLSSLLRKFPNLYLYSVDYSCLIEQYKLYSNIFWYFDPPYEKTFTGYLAGGFDSKKFWDNICVLNGKWVISNSGRFLNIMNNEKCKIFNMDIKYNIRPHNTNTDVSSEIIILSPEEIHIDTLYTSYN